jgi:hypothetical protein
MGAPGPSHLGTGARERPGPALPRCIRPAYFQGGAFRFPDVARSLGTNPSETSGLATTQQLSSLMPGSSEKPVIHKRVINVGWQVRVRIMNSGDWSWYSWGIAKLVLLAIPAAWILIHWRRRGVACRAVFCASCANVFCYALWVALIMVMIRMDQVVTLRSMVPISLPAIAFVFIPFFLSIASLLLCISALAAAKGERQFASLANGLMLALWVTSVVAPN